MVWSWYPVQRVDETLLDGVPDESVELDLQNVGIETIRFIDGFNVGVIFRNVLLVPNMNGRNPFTKNDEVGAMIYEEQYWIGINDGDE